MSWGEGRGEGGEGEGVKLQLVEETYLIRTRREKKSFVLLLTYALTQESHSLGSNTEEIAPSKALLIAS